MSDQAAAITPTKRRRQWVDPEVQGGVLWKISFHWLLLFVCNTLALTIWIRLFEQPEAGWGESLVDTVKRFLPFFVVSLVLVPAFAWDTLRLTNRFAGPMLRFRAALRDAVQGRHVEPLTFRGNDFWKEIAENFNAVVRSDRTELAPADDADSDRSANPRSEG
ncbi:MAG: hypothetical protein AAF958_06470 [Planctomycetota bacterium]